MARTRREAPAAESDPEAQPVRGRRRYWGRRKPAAAGPGTGAAGSAALAASWLARLSRRAAWILAAIIVAGILLIVLSANASNSIVSSVRDTARSLVGPFDGMFNLHDHKLAIAINWGIAAFVYVIVGSARLVVLAGSAGLRRRRIVAR
jgi:hypothetical protein